MLWSGLLVDVGLPAESYHVGGEDRGASFRDWLVGAAKRLHHNVLAAALANKLARIAWSVLYHGRSFARDFEPQSVS